MVERDEKGMYHEVTERDRKYHNEKRSTWLCRMLGHKFTKWDVANVSDYCFRCAFNKRI